MTKVSEKTAEHPFAVVATRVRPVKCSPEDVEDPAWYRDPEPKRDETREPEKPVEVVFCYDKTDAEGQFGVLASRFPSSQGFRVKVLPGGAR